MDKIPIRADKESRVSSGKPGTVALALKEWRER